MPFTFFAVAGQVGYNVPIVCWVDSVNGNHLGKSVDSYFVLSLVVCEVIDCQNIWAGNVDH